MSKKNYQEKTVLQASQDRIAYIFDNFTNISVSVSGGKDSTVLFHLAYQEAVARNRSIEVLFIDQEAEYKATIDIIRSIKDLPLVKMRWLQVPFLMTNSTSYSEDYLHCWDGKEIRKREADSIKSGFADNLTWEKLLVEIEKQHLPNTACLLGLRSSESLNRYRAVVKNPAYKNIFWSSKTAKENVFKFYPIYDWEFEDVWKYIYQEQIFYNRIYDFQFVKKYKKDEMRVSCLIHDKSMKCLADLPEFEFDTFEWLCKRCNGIDTAMRYIRENKIYSADELPSGFRNYKDFRDFLLKNHHNHYQKQKFVKRFNTMPNNEEVARQQVKSLLINDWEFLNQIDSQKEAKKIETKQKWQNL